MKTDVLIIGGGSIGLHAAYYLLQSGRGVTIVDQAEIGKGSSSGNAGHIVPSHIIPLAAPGVPQDALRWLFDPQNSPFGLKISLSPVYLAWLLRFVLACTPKNVQHAIPALKALGLQSAQNFEQIIRREAFSCSYQQSGLLFLYNTAAALQAATHEAETLRQNGIPAETLHREALLAREPAASDRVVGGIHYTADASLNPSEYLRLLKDRLIQMGAVMRENTPITGFEMSAGRIQRALSPQAEFTPQLVLLAAGAWSPRLGRALRLPIPIQPARGYSLTFPAPPNPPQHALLLGERRVAVTPFPAQNSLRITGRLEVGEMSLAPNPRWLNALRRAAAEYLILGAEPPLSAEAWAGLRPVTPTGLPILGYSPQHANLLLAAGHAMLGLSLGPGSGQLLTQLANRAPTFCDPTPFQISG